MSELNYNDMLLIKMYNDVNNFLYINNININLLLFCFILYGWFIYDHVFVKKYIVVTEYNSHKGKKIKVLSKNPISYDEAIRFMNDLKYQYNTQAISGFRKPRQIFILNYSKYNFYEIKYS